MLAFNVFRVIGRWYESMRYGQIGGSGPQATYIITLVAAEAVYCTSIYIPGTFDHSNIIQWYDRHAKIIHLSIQNTTIELVYITYAICNLQ
jgi:hypothetical protein